MSNLSLNFILLPDTIHISNTILWLNYSKYIRTECMILSPHSFQISVTQCYFWFEGHRVDQSVSWHQWGLKSEADNRNQTIIWDQLLNIIHQDIELESWILESSSMIERQNAAASKAQNLDRNLFVKANLTNKDFVDQELIMREVSEEWQLQSKKSTSALLVLTRTKPRNCILTTIEI